MPLPLRKVEPVYVSRGNIPDKVPVPNDLEAEANGTLANVILQLSSLSHHAEEIFSDLVVVASDISVRSTNLQGRLDRIAVKVRQLDGIHDEISMQDCLNTKPFQSSTNFDQQVVSRRTMTKSMLKTHSSCDQPPPLDKLNEYRDDQKDGLKFYTDPSYFFDLWRKEILKDTEKAVRKPHKPKSDGRSNKKRPRQPNNTRDKHKNQAILGGEVIMTQNQIPSSNDAQTSNPIEVGSDGIIHPPMMKKSNSRPVSMEFQKVSFDLIDDIDGDEEEEKMSASVPEQRLDELLKQPSLNYTPVYNNSANSYSAFTKESSNSTTLNNSKNDQNQNEIDINRSPLRNDNSYTLQNPYVYDVEGRNNSLQALRQVQNNNIRNSPSSTNILTSLNQQQHRSEIPVVMRVASRTGSTTSSRRRSSASSDNSMKTPVLRPLNPPPPPPSTTPNSSYQVSVSGTPSSVSKAGTPTVNGNNNVTPNGVRMMMTSSSAARESLPPPPPPPENEMNDGSSEGQGDRMNDDNDDLPPPPPPPGDVDVSMSKPVSNMKSSSLQEEVLPPTPPPPPPPPEEMPEPVQSNNNGAGVLKKEKKVIEVVPDTRSQLLEAIRGGKKLRAVDVTKEKQGKEDTAECRDVASLLRLQLIRAAVEMSESDSDSEEYDSDGW